MRDSVICVWGILRDFRKRKRNKLQASVFYVFQKSSNFNSQVQGSRFPTPKLLSLHNILLRDKKCKKWDENLRQNLLYFRRIVYWLHRVTWLLPMPQSLYQCCNLLTNVAIYLLQFLYWCCSVFTDVAMCLPMLRFIYQYCNFTCVSYFINYKDLPDLFGILIFFITFRATIPVKESMKIAINYVNWRKSTWKVHADLRC